MPMRIAPGAHFSMGGLWTDFDSMSNLAGLFVGGEASWAYHGANRLGANSLLSACVDGWFTLPVVRAELPGITAGHRAAGPRRSRGGQHRGRSADRRATPARHRRHAIPPTTSTASWATCSMPNAG